MLLRCVLIFAAVALASGQRGRYGQGHNYNNFGNFNNMYKVPQPMVEAQHPKGLKIWINATPRDQEVTITTAINGAIGGINTREIAIDISEPYKGQWIYFDDDACLKPGDYVNINVHVLHNGMSYNELFTIVVQELIGGSSENTNNVAPTPNPNSNGGGQESQCNCQELSMLQSQVNQTKNEVANLENQVASLTQELEELRDLQTELIMELSHNNVSMLIVTGYMESDDTPVETVKKIIREMLQFADDSIHVLSAVKRETINGITFTVETYEQKLKVLVRARKLLKGTKLKIASFSQKDDELMPDIDIRFAGDNGDETTTGKAWA